MNRPQSPCLGCKKRNETCHGTCCVYRWYEAELDIYNEFVKVQKHADRIDYPEGQLKRMRGWK